MADQCIVCLDNLDVQVEAAGAPQLPSPFGGRRPEGLETEKKQDVRAEAVTNDDGYEGSNFLAPAAENHESIAVIQACGHILHDSCLREWIEKANSCPICRQIFHEVAVYDKVGGSLLSSYEVEDKKQVAEFDPQVWMDENSEEELVPCPVCNLADREDVLLLCDGCDTPYHTHCIGLDDIPRGHWFCMECQHILGPEVTETVAVSAASRRGASSRSQRSHLFPRTQASRRRARQRDSWHGAWGQIAGHVWDALELDLDYQDDEEPSMWEGFRRTQQLRSREVRERQRWQQRLNIASRQGARDQFESSMPEVFIQRVIPAQRPRAPESRDERRAWGALERARDATSPTSRKRKSRSATAEPGEGQEPERKLKRPRTRRLPAGNGESSSSKLAAASSPTEQNGSSLGVSSSFERPRLNNPAPSFLSSLLKEVEMSTPSDEENLRNLFGPIPGANGASSPAPSPPASGYSSPRASSLTPPPNHNGCPGSPTLSLSSHIVPIYPPANYSPTKQGRPHQRTLSSPDSSDSESTKRHRAASDIRHPRPRRPQTAEIVRAQYTSPSRATLPYEMKQNISSIVRSALKPMWKANKLTSEQYATINRDVSRKIYEEVTDPASVDDEAKHAWEKIASREVAQAVAGLPA